ncbi:hypothetical protein OIDMADRAFT_39565 [Oidiodendron maius Zn]|uniref:HNH nuclease domain-containing protein n=1 Tax=Oidiodendron maius (strain Zn) TaxID=913774 RepID=A0A0C3HQA0_OIDMZ|nr:hypothetical protein OIDMADRAFT_39565 [Oidiodendron maius Zn]
MAPPRKRPRSASPPASASPRRKSTRLLQALVEAAKERITKYQSQNRVHEDILQPSLKAFVEWLPEGGQESIARDIINATTDKELYNIFYNLLTGIVVPMMALSKHDTGMYFDVVERMLNSPQARDSKFRDLCHQRDSYRCVITGDMDTNYWEKTLGCPEGVHFSKVRAAHIIPLNYATWDKLLDIDDVYELKLYDYFPSSYERIFPKKSLVEFARAENTQDLEPPNATLLDCHYRLAEILNASGMARLVDDYLWGYGYTQDSAGRSPDIERILYLAFWGDGVG